MASGSTTEFFGCLWLFFQVGSCGFARDGLDLNLPIYTSCVTRMTGAHHHNWLVLLR
jgi:hypothetical protein